MRSSTSVDNEIARFVGTFSLALDEGVNRSPICEITLETKSHRDDAIDADRLTDRKFRLIRCGTGIEERGTYRILSDGLFKYIELTGPGAEARHYRLGTSVLGDIQIQHWYYPEDELKRAAEQNTTPKKAVFDAWTFARTGDFWCNDTSNCDGQYLGCFTRRTSIKGGGLKNCENGPPWACVNNTCRGVASK